MPANLPANLPVLANGNPSPTDPRSLLALFDTLTSGDAGSAARHLFLQPPAFLPAASLYLVKDTLEGFAGSVSDQQLERLRAANKRKRKREEGDGMEVLKMRKVHIDGFRTDQVWQQAKRIIGSALDFSERAVRELEENREIGLRSKDGGRSITSGPEEEAVSEPESELSDEENGWDDEYESDEGDMHDGAGGDEDGPDDRAANAGDVKDGPEPGYTVDPFGLNDGFFNIDEFNRQSLLLEDQDARGDPNTDHASDDEDIDWTADPFAPLTKKRVGKRSNGVSEDANVLSMSELREEEHDDDDDDEDENGPTFGNMSLNAPEGASDDEADGLTAEGEEPEFSANDVYYKDFFAPPPKLEVHNDSQPKKTESFAPPDSDGPDNADIERAMDDVHRDLFDDLSNKEGSEDELSDVSDGDPKSRRSAHERRQAKLAEEIRRLESELVAKRAWTLSGEAAAPERPVNSLLEEDLDFEHVGKPVPVITAEVSEDIEAMIKRRILAQEFDEVMRRRPDAGTVPASARRGLVALDDAKASKGLAEIYEEEHVKAANPDSYVGQADEKLHAEERAVEQLWRDVSAKLDALSSWHYRPRPAEASLAVVADVATVSMEDAQPTTAQGVASGLASALAPQEIYRPGGDAEGERPAAGEVVLKSGVAVAKQEMSREEKLRRRRREKERMRKAGAGAGTGAAAAAAAAKKLKTGAGTADDKIKPGRRSERDTIADLKKGQVAVINRKGELVGVDGKKAKATKVPTAGGYKL